MRRVAFAILGSIAVIAFLVWVWPTRYRPIELRGGSLRILAAREDRFTHAVEGLTANGWEPLETPDDPDAVCKYLRKYRDSAAVAGSGCK